MFFDFGMVVLYINLIKYTKIMDNSITSNLTWKSNSEVE